MRVNRRLWLKPTPEQIVWLKKHGYLWVASEKPQVYKLKSLVGKIIK